MHGMTDNLEFRYVNAALTASSSIDDNSDRIDMSGYESVTFVTPITDSAATGVATLTVQANDDDSDTGMAAVTGGAATATCAVNDDLNGTLLIAEYRKPLDGDRYVQATLTSATANIAYGATLAILRPLRRPATQGATVSDTAYVSG
jgi:hypothetical protein